MKNRTFLPFYVVLILFLCYSMAFSGEHPKDFRGLTWGTHISKVSGLVLQKEGEQGIKFYSRPSDKLKIGDGEVDAIRYKFLKNQLIGVVFDFKNYDQYLNLKSLFLDIFGPPDREEDSRKEKGGGHIKHFWYAKKNDEANVTLYWIHWLGVKDGFAAMEWKGALKKDTGL